MSMKEPYSFLWTSVALYYQCLGFYASHPSVLISCRHFSSLLSPTSNASFSTVKVIRNQPSSSVKKPLPADIPTPPAIQRLESLFSRSWYISRSDGESLCVERLLLSSASPEPCRYDLRSTQTKHPALLLQTQLAVQRFNLIWYVNLRAPVVWYLVCVQKLCNNRIMLA